MSRPGEEGGKGEMVVKRECKEAGRSKAWGGGEKGAEGREHRKRSQNKGTTQYRQAILSSDVINLTLELIFDSFCFASLSSHSCVCACVYVCACVCVHMCVCMCIRVLYVLVRVHSSRL